MNEPNAVITDGSTGPSHEEISTLAYSIWVSEGCPEGRHDANWHEAERQLLAPGSSKGAASRSGD